MFLFQTREAKGITKKFGFIRYRGQEEARKAMNDWNWVEIRGARLQVTREENSASNIQEVRKLEVKEGDHSWLKEGR